MPYFFQPDWTRMFALSEPLFETVIRGSCMYLALFVMLRLFRRQAGALGPADLLVLLLIADAAQNGMAGEYKSITDGLILVGTIIFWEYALDWLAFRFPICKRWIDQEPRTLIENGRINHDALRGELLTLDDLLSHLRQKGVDNPAVVRMSKLEGDGHFSVILQGAPVVQSDDDDDDREH